jgi:hypothetical protein
VLTKGVSTQRLVQCHGLIISKPLDLATNSELRPSIVNYGATYQITGVDILPANIEKAKVLARLNNNSTASFLAADAFGHLMSQDDSDLGARRFLSSHRPARKGKPCQKTRKVATIETVVQKFPFSGWFQTVTRQIKYPELMHAYGTQKNFELHSTYRGLIDTLFWVGFSEVHEIVLSPEILANNEGTIFATRNRGLLIGIKGYRRRLRVRRLQRKLYRGSATMGAWGSLQAGI